MPLKWCLSICWWANFACIMPDLFDPGFGHQSGHGEGAWAVLEVRSHEVPFILEDWQIIGRLVYEPLTETPSQVYGQGIGSNYQRQGLKLSKHFRPYDLSKR